MTHKLPLQKISMIRILLIFIFSNLFYFNVDASHFRHGTISWTRQPGTNTITFRIHQSWRSSFSTWSQSLTVGGTVSSGEFQLNYGDGQSDSYTLNVTQLFTAGDWFEGETTLTHTYASNTPVMAYIDGCCRIDNSMNNNGDAGYRIETEVNFIDLAGSNLPNNSPVTSMLPFISVSNGSNTTYQIPATDPDGQPLTFSLSTPAQMCGNTCTGVSQPPGLSISPSGLLTFNTLGITTGYWNASIRISDPLGAVTTVDFLINVVSSGSSPNFTAPTPAENTTVKFYIGTANSLYISAIHPNIFKTLEVTAVELPAGSALNPPQPVGNQVSATINWTPTMNDLGIHRVRLVAIDVDGIMVQRSFNINVTYPVAFQSPTPAQNSRTGFPVYSFYGSPNSTFTSYPSVYSFNGPLTIPIVAVDSMATGGITFSFTIISPAGGTFAYSLSPTTSNGNTYSSNLNWFTSTGFRLPEVQTIRIRAQNRAGAFSEREFSFQLSYPPYIRIDSDIRCLRSNQVYTTSVSAETNPFLGVRGVSESQDFLPLSPDFSAITTPSWVSTSYSTWFHGRSLTISGTWGERELRYAAENEYGYQTERRYRCVINDPPGFFNPSVSGTMMSATIPNPIVTATNNQPFNYTVGCLEPNAQYGDTFNVTVTSPMPNWLSVNYLRQNSGSKQIVFSGTPSLADVGTYHIVVELNDKFPSCNGFTRGEFDIVVPPCPSDPPTITCGATQVISTEPQQCSANVTIVPPTFSNTCGITTLTNTITNTDNASGNYPLGSTTVIWTVMDERGSSATCSQVVQVVDHEFPTITCGPNVSRFVTPGSCQTEISLTSPVVADNCSTLSLTNDFNHSSSVTGTFNRGLTTIVWTVTDGNGNASTCSQTVQVTDNEAPQISCPAVPSTIASTGNCSAQVNVPFPVVLDNCSSNLTLTNNITNTSNASGIFPVGNTSITWTVTDESGNNNTCVQNVAVIDNEPPQILCGTKISAVASSGNCSALITVVSPYATDNCGTVTVTNNFNQSQNASGNYPVGSTIITWTATDSHGNSSSCTQTVQVIDNQPPLISNCPANISLNSCQQTASWTPPTATDCQLQSFTSTHTPGSSFPVGTTTVTYTATDADGRSSTCSFTVNRLNSLNMNTSIQNASAWQVCDGSVSVNASGGLTPLLYSIDNGITYQTTSVFNNLCAGNYTVTVKDQNNCTLSTSLTITQPGYLCGSTNEYTDADVGAWGAQPNGNNIANVWLYPNFSTVYGTGGLFIGSGSNFLRFTSPQSITNWLPSGSTARQLNSGTLTNPINSSTSTTYPCSTCPVYSNVLGSKVLALTLNVDFDRVFPNFNPASTVTFGDLRYTTTPFSGWTVKAILAEANRLLGQGLCCGQTSTYYSTMVTALDRILNGQYLRCPAVNARYSSEEAQIDESSSLSLYPNPTNGDLNIKINTKENVQIWISDLIGQTILTQEFINTDEEFHGYINLNGIKHGLYIVTIHYGSTTEIRKVIVSQ